MSLDPTLVHQFSESLTRAFEQAIRPLLEELEELRAEVAALRSGGSGRTPATPLAPREPLKNTNGGAKAVTRRSRATTVAPTCLVPHCKAAVLEKQLCETHYRVMRRAQYGGQNVDTQ